MQSIGGSRFEASTLSGKPLTRPALSAEQRARLEADLAAAQAEYDKNPRDAERAIWLGRRLGYLGRYRDAIAIYTTALALHPDDAKLYRHRGHRYISIRQFDNAVADFEKAASLVEGIARRDRARRPAERGQHSDEHAAPGNIWYHLGLAHYLRSDFARQRCARTTRA